MGTVLYAQRQGATVYAVFDDPIAADEYSRELSDTGWSVGTWPWPVAA